MDSALDLQGKGLLAIVDVVMEVLTVWGLVLRTDGGEMCSYFCLGVWTSALLRRVGGGYTVASSMSIHIRSTSL